MMLSNQKTPKMCTSRLLGYRFPDTMWSFRELHLWRPVESGLMLECMKWREKVCVVLRLMFFIMGKLLSIAWLRWKHHVVEMHP